VTGRWNWRSPANEGIWKHGAPWARPFFAAAPWVTAALAAVMLGFASDRLAAAPGIVFDLPTGPAADGEAAALTALVLPSSDASGSIVFFEDARYRLADPANAAQFGAALSARSGGTAGTLLLVTDKRVPTGDLTAVVAAARAAGFRHVQVAEKRN